MIDEVSLEDFLTWCRARIEADKDVVILFTGEEGAGKSTIAFQLMWALDGTFDAARCFFSQEDFLAAQADLEAGQAVLFDEMSGNKRAAMKNDRVKLLETYQVNRGQNLVHGWCFPHVGLLDQALLDYRPQWRVHVPRTGLFELRRRSAFERKDGSQLVRWPVVGRFSFQANSGPLWSAYLRKKKRHMDAAGDKDPASRSRLEDALDFYLGA